VGWFFRKSFRLLPGIRISLSKSGPRLSVGVPGARASVGLDGKTRIYGGKGPIRYQKTMSPATAAKSSARDRLLASFLRVLIGRR
jgi:uncharacterized protein DUF4236